MLTKNLLVGTAFLGLIACGQGPVSPKAESELKIYGGSKVGAQEEIARYTVVLLQNNNPVCTGVLVAPRLVLTAAHCYYLANSGRGISIGFGLKAKSTEEVAVKRFVPHEAFDLKAGQAGGTEQVVNDISLIELAADAPAGYTPVGVLGRNDELKSGEKVVLAGFGKTDVSTGLFGWGKVLGELYKVETEVVLESAASKEVWLGNTPGKSACNGDSGGPALVQRENGMKLLGLTSRGRDCKSEVIYTDVRYFRDWIAQNSSLAAD